MRLLAQMERLVADAETRVRELTAAGDTDTHCQICGELSDRFELWESCGDGEVFPMWLSRVVAGVIADVEEGL